MSEVFQSMLIFLFEKEVGFSKDRAKKLCVYFNCIDDLKNVTKEQLRRNVTDIRGRPNIKLKDEELEKIIATARCDLIDPDKSVVENYVKLLCRNFTQTQLNLVQNLVFEKVSPNPLLIKSLNLTTPRECVEFNVYAYVTRSIVTSMGFLVEHLLVSSSDDVEKIKNGWDLVKTTSDGKQHFIQVKSGPNDMDKDQVITWNDEIKKAIEKGDNAYIGITYGKRDNDTVTIGLFKRYLENWEQHTLIGRELWDFLSGDPHFHEKLFQTLWECGVSVLKDHSLCEEINRCIDRLTGEFIEKYGDGNRGVQNYIENIF